jgi:prevent-host-death family protein
LKDNQMAQTIVGIRELKAQLSRYVRQVKAGTTLVITERGKPVGRIVPIKPSVEAQMQDLLQTGLVAWNGHKLVSKAPVAQAQGDKTVADLLLEDRG